MTPLDDGGQEGSAGARSHDAALGGESDGGDRPRTATKITEASTSASTAATEPEKFGHAGKDLAENVPKPLGRDLPNQFVEFFIQRLQGELDQPVREVVQGRRENVSEGFASLRSR